MDLLNRKINPLYFRYLSAAFGIAIITSVYSIVDTAFVVSVAQGLVVSGALILLLPSLVGTDSLWFAMPITELLAAVYAALAIRSFTVALPKERTCGALERHTGWKIK